MRVLLQRFRILATGSAVLLAGCLRAAPPPPPAAPPAPPPPPPPPEVVWTERADVEVRADSVTFTLPRPFTRLDVVERDSLGHLLVTCPLCATEVAGTVLLEDVLFEPRSPAESAVGSLADFALAIRDAAAWRRVESLPPVMASDFTFGFSAQRDRGVTITAWEWENFRNLDQVPRLLDAGLVRIDDDFWVAPADYAERPGYQGLRLGFKRNPTTGRWEWLFLVRGEL